MNLTETIVPKSDQLNADDLIAGPVTVTIAEVRKGSIEQPVDVILEEFRGRAYRPSKSMRRVMVEAWGPEAAAYAGRRLTLFRNPEIKFGAEKVGGIEISHLSDIDKPMTIALTATRGKRKNFRVEPLGVETGRNWLGELADLTTRDQIGALGADATAAKAPQAIVTAIRQAYMDAPVDDAAPARTEADS